MRFSYTITTKQCPTCGKILERHNDGWKTILCILFFPFVLIYLVYFFAAWVLSNYILTVYIPKIGDSYIICPICKTKIETGKKSYNELDDIDKILYNNRGLFRIAYFLGGTMLLSLPVAFFRLSTNPVDKSIGTFGNISFAICLILLFFITIYWKQKFKSINNKDESKEKQINIADNNDQAKSGNEIKPISHFKKEDLSDLLNLSDVNFDFTDADIKNIQSDLKTHSKENLPKFFIQFKQKTNDDVLKDIAMTFCHMYARQDTLLVIAKDKALPIVNTTFGRYLPVYTEEKFFNNLLGNRYVEQETKAIFELFYLLNSMDKCEGIVFNYGTESMVLLPKITVDHIGFDKVFNVSWKK